MATSATLSDLADLHARLHDLSVVAARTRGRQRVLLASVPSASEWAGPAAVAYTTHRLTLRAAALGSLADALDAVARGLAAVAAAVRPLGIVPLDGASPASSVRALQRLLVSAGVSPGSVDGTWGASTTAAVARVQRDAGLPSTGALDPATALALSAAGAGGAVAIGGRPGVPRGLLPLSGAHPVEPAPAAPAPPPAVAAPTAAADPAPPDGSTDNDPTDPTDPADPTDAADPGDPDGDGEGDGVGEDADPGPDPGPDVEGADPGPTDSPALRELLRSLGRPPAPAAFS